MSEKRNLIIIISAGRGERMKSKTPKVMHTVANKPIIEYVLDLAEKISSTSLNRYEVAIVVNSDLFSMQSFTSIVAKHQIFGHDPKIVLQENPLGTTDAVSKVFEVLDINQYHGVVILYGDTPLLQYECVLNAVNLVVSGDDNISSCNICFDSSDTKLYGLMKFDESGYLKDIVEQRSDDLISDNSYCYDRNQRFTYNVGFMAVKAKVLSSFIATGYKDITRIISFSNSLGYKTLHVFSDEKFCIGINTRRDLQLAESVMQEVIVYRHMENGVSIINPSSTFFSYDTIIGKDSVVYPNVYFGLDVHIHENVKIFSFSHLENVLIHDDVNIGPFARISGSSVIEKKSAIGNFVEVKRSQISQGVKIKHLSYIGDANVGASTNIGAGTVFCNFDGKKKHKTFVGESAFIGANSSIIAPIRVGNKAKIAAGSVIRKDVPDEYFATSSVVQRNKEDRDKS